MSKQESKGLKLIERPKIPWAIYDDRKWSPEEQINLWFDTNLKDYYAVHKDDLVRVYGPMEFSLDNTDPLNKRHIKYGHQAFLIKSSIEPIKKESAEDILSDMMTIIESGKDPEAWGELYDRTKQLLGSSRSEPSTINQGVAEESVQETCADVLRDVVKAISDKYDPSRIHADIYDRAKAALERESAEGGPSVVGEGTENNTRGES